MTVLIQNTDSSIVVEIVIFSYSSGKELFSYSEDTQGDVLTRIQTGKADALVKIKRNNELKKVFFVNAAGNTKKEILHRLAIASRNVLCGL